MTDLCLIYGRGASEKDGKSHWYAFTGEAYEQLDFKKKFPREPAYFPRDHVLNRNYVREFFISIDEKGVIRQDDLLPQNEGKPFLDVYPDFSEKEKKALRSSRGLLADEWIRPLDKPAVLTDDIPPELKEYQKKHPRMFPNPEGFRTKYCNEGAAGGYDPFNSAQEGGEITFLCHKDTPKGPWYYLTGYRFHYKDKPKVDYAYPKYPVTPDILKLDADARNALEFFMRVPYESRNKEFPVLDYISDPEIRGFLEQEQPRIDREVFGNGPHYIDKFDAYYRKMVEALLDSREPEFPVERIAASMEQAVPFCWPDYDYYSVHNPFNSEDGLLQPARDTEYIVRMMDEMLQKRDANEDEKEALAAYRKAFHGGPLDLYFCHCATVEEERFGLSLRLTRQRFPELPPEAPTCYTFEFFEAGHNNRPIRKENIFLDDRPQEKELVRDFWHKEACPIIFSARQESLLHCMKNPDLAEKIDWDNPQNGITANSVTALRSYAQDVFSQNPAPEHLFPQQNDYPSPKNFQIESPDKFYADMPLFSTERRDLADSLHGEWVFKEEMCDAERHVIFSGNPKVQEADPEELRIQSSVTPLPNGAYSSHSADEEGFKRSFPEEKKDRPKKKNKISQR